MATKTKGVASRVDSLLNGLVDRLEKVEQLTIEQFPLICKEIIAERRVEIENEMIVEGVSTLIALTTLVLTVCMAMNQNNVDYVRVPCGIVAFITVIATSTLSMCALSNFLKLRELAAAPKVYVLRQLKRMVR